MKKGIAAIIIVSIIAAFLVGIGATVGYIKFKSSPAELLQSMEQQRPVSYPTSNASLLPSPTPDETANWKTYTNQKYSFLFKYRPDLTIEEENNIIRLNYIGTLEPYEKLFHSKFIIKENPNNFSPSEYAKKELCKGALFVPERNIDTSENCNKLVNENIKNYQNNNISGIQTIYNLFENPMYAIIFTNNNKIIILESTGETGSGPTNLGKQTIDQILSTFEFIE